jgi:DNA primase
MSGLIPKEFIDDLMMRVDIVEVIDSRVPLKKAGKDYTARCPFHEEKTPSFTVSPDKQFYHCFGCGAHGTAIGFLMDYEHLSFPEAVEELASQVGMKVPREENRPGAAPTASVAPNLLKVLEEADHYYRRQLREHPDAHLAVDYLKGRGLTGQIAAEFGIGYAPDGWDNLLRELGRDEAAREAMFEGGLLIKKDSGGYYDRFRSRIMFPIHDHRGRIVGFGGRIVGKGEADAQGSASVAGGRKPGAAKYLNSPETPLFHKGRELYGLFQARDTIKREQRAIIVEGYMDVVALAQFGIRIAVATLGTATTPAHLERIFRTAPEVVFCFDGDRAGREAAWRALENALPALHEGRQVSFLFLPEGEDPDTLVRKEGADAFRKRLDDAVPLPDFLFDALAARVDLGRLDGRARLAELARPLLSRLPQGVFRQLMVDRLANLTQLEAASLERMLRGGEPPTASAGPARSAARPGRPTASLVRKAVALVVQHPALASAVSDELAALRDLELAGVPLLCSLLDLLKERPDMSTGAIIEHYRGSEHQAHLEKLAHWEHMVEQDGLKREFEDALSQLRIMTLDQLHDRLLSKTRPGDLSPQEKRLLADIYTQKQQLQQRLARH